MTKPKVLLILILSTLLLAAPGEGLSQQNFGIKVTKIKATAIYTNEVPLDWVLYSAPLAKQTITINDEYQDSGAQRTIQAIPEVGALFDSALGLLFRVFQLDIDPGRTGTEIIFKDNLPLVDVQKPYKAEPKSIEFDVNLATGIGLHIWIEMGAGVGAGAVEIQNPLQAGTFQELIERLIDFVFVISVAVAPLMLLVAGFLFLTAGGAPDKIGRAKQMILWTIIGFSIVLLAKGMIAVVEQILGG